MASVIMLTTATSPFLGGSASTRKLPATTLRRGVMAVRASKDSSVETVVKDQEGSNTRRGLMFASLAVAASSVAKAAMADEPKPGTAEAKKKYAPICVTMPTARICRY